MNHVSEGPPAGQEAAGSSDDRPADEPDDAPDSGAFPIHPEAERYHIRCAWKTVTGSKDDEAFFECPMVATLFAAVCCTYEGAEDDPPIAGVLQAIRETVKGWLRARTGSAPVAFVAFADLVLLMRRVDVALALARYEDDRAMDLRAMGGVR